MVTQAEALTDRTTTHRLASVVSDPSELGSEPDSWLENRLLRARKKIQIVGTRASRERGQPRQFQVVTSCQQKNTKHACVDNAWVVSRAKALADRIHDAQSSEPSQRPERAGQRARQLVGVQLPARAQEDSDRGHAREPRAGAATPLSGGGVMSVEEDKNAHIERAHGWWRGPRH